MTRLPYCPIPPLRLALAMLVGMPCLGSTAWAQTVTPPLAATTDPAQLQRQRENLERLRLPPKPVDPKLTAPPTEPDAASAPGPTFALKHVEFTSSQLLSQAELDGIVAAQIGKPTSFADVKRLAQDINALYLAKGHLTARAFVPSQRVAEGTLKVQLIEAKLARLEPADHSRLSPRFVADLLATPEGSLIDAPAINDRLTRLHRNTPDNRIGLAFTAAEGKNSGLSVIKVQTEEPPWWAARVSASNEGADSLGKNQLSVNLALNNLLGWTDKLSLLAIRSEGSTSGNLQYSVPLPGPFLAWGTRLSAAVSKGKTQSVSPGFESVLLDGDSNGGTLALAQPLWRSHAWSLEGTLSAGRTQSATAIAAQKFSEISTRSGALSVNLGYLDETTSATVGLAYNRALTRIVTLDSQSGAGVFQLNLNFQQVIGGGFWALGRSVIQRSAQDRLPATLQFQAGGPGSVRGYLSPSVSGDQGETLSLELHRPVSNISERLEGYAFIDAARVQRLAAQRVDGESVDVKVIDRLASVGVGLTYTADSWGLSLAVASPRKALAKDQKDSSRVLLRASVDLEKFLN
ncbi:MAG: ShlB/FhaC/HecB family hemolysin secretion/activation protein [Microbacteriaceae bacterium]|nr:ShlB/FhaC/HecB family hemolysin secretion/activation protein [Burkholderiaceae bacterium]